MTQYYTRPVSHWDLRFLDGARRVAGWSKDPSTRVGAIIADGSHRIVSVGFNGFPAGMADTPARYADRDDKYSRIIHAEMNALLHMRERPTPDMTVYTWPLPPCDRCVVHLLQAGLRHFVAPENWNEFGTRAHWQGAIDRATGYIHEMGGTIRLL